jgi:RHS repeat-associated protein
MMRPGGSPRWAALPLGDGTTRRTDGAKLCTERFYEPRTGRIDRQTVRGGGTACSGSAIATFDLGYDAASNVTTRIQTVGTGTGANPLNGTYAYTYDAAGRLISATGPSSFGSRTYGYDGAGNRTSVQTGTGTPVTTTYDASGLPTSSSDGTTYTHDQVGNLSAIDRSGSSNDRFFTYSSWNATTKAASTPTGSDVTFTLDALDRVLSRTSGSTTATSTYSGLGETLAKAQVGNSTTTYVHTPGGPLAQKAGNTTRYYVRDLHGDLVAWSDNKAAFKGTAAYDPFGQVLSATGEMGTVPAQGALRFQGDLTDAFTGQVDMGARWYEPGLGRFASADPLQGELTSPLSLNRFVYGISSPVSFDDPTGLCADPDICPPQIGGTTEYHSDAWIAIGETHARAEAGAYSVDVIEARPGILTQYVPAPTASFLGVSVTPVDLLSGLVSALEGVDVAAAKLFAAAAATIGRLDTALNLSSRGWGLRDSLIGRLGARASGQRYGRTLCGVNSSASHPFATRSAGRSA